MDEKYYFLNDHLTKIILSMNVWMFLFELIYFVRTYPVHLSYFKYSISDIFSSVFAPKKTCLIYQI
jgi:hypothetical protein